MDYRDDGSKRRAGGGEGDGGRESIIKIHL